LLALPATQGKVPKPSTTKLFTGVTPIALFNVNLISLYVTNVLLIAPVFLFAIS